MNILHPSFGIGYVPSKADADFWMKKHKDACYEYIANYVDDFNSFSKDPMSVIEELKKDYMLKGVGEPEYYLFMWIHLIALGRMRMY